MKVVLLTAGLGTRLRPLTDDLPKSMMDIGGKPLLERHLEHLINQGFGEVWINLSWLPGKVTNYFGDGKKWGMRIKYSMEEELLGTAGALKNPDSKIEQDLGGQRLLIIYGDNLSNFDYRQLIEKHVQAKAVLSMGLYKSLEPWTCGVVETDQVGRVLKMVEKPPVEKVTTDVVNAGVYVCEPEIIDFIPQGKFCDFGFDVIPKLIEQGKPVYAWDFGNDVQDIGTHERLAKARQMWENSPLWPKQN